VELKGNGILVEANVAEQSDEWLIATGQEIADAAQERGLELPFAAGSVAVEAATTGQPESANEVRESLFVQLNRAYVAYETVSERLGSECGRKDQLKPVSGEAFTMEFEDWLTDEKIAFVEEAMEADPELSFMLVATPNVEVKDGEVQRLAQTFGEQQPYGTYIYDNLYKKYPAAELAGTDPSNGKSVMFSLIPNKLSESLTGTVQHQLAQLEAMQASHPFVRVPSVLEAISYWHTLQSSGDGLQDNETFDCTYIRHFDMDPKRIGGWLRVPFSYVDDGGQPGLRDSFAENGNSGRVVVG